MSPRWPGSGASAIGHLTDPATCAPFSKPRRSAILARVGRQRTRWEDWPENALLDTRLCDLDLDLSSCWLAEQVDRLHEELAARGLKLKPHCWLSTEWFSPEGVPGIAIPFFLAHPRLKRIERRQILYVEGGTPASCMRLLRHEAGHALQHAFRLHRRRRWQRVFGLSSAPYPEYYRPKPASRRFVMHLDDWYAQAHPDEDFAETFAVWLTPGSAWRKRYAGWPALEKLEYVDALMTELAGATPPVRSRRQVEPMSRNRTTLREYYAQRRARYRITTTRFYDDDLLRLFRPPPSRAGEPAAQFLKRHRARIRSMVLRSTGGHPLPLDTVLGEMIARCRELKLRAVGQRRLEVELAILLAARSVEYPYRRREWHIL